MRRDVAGAVPGSPIESKGMTMLNHTRKLLPLLRELTTTRADATIAVRRRRAQYRTTYLAEVTVWELNGHGERRSPIGVFTLARWCPTTGELFADDGDRVSGGHWDVYRETARANKDALDAIAEYAREQHAISVAHAGFETIRARHFRIGH